MGTQILVIDCMSQEDVEAIARALGGSGLPFLVADPGPLTAACARLLVGRAGLAQDDAHARAVHGGRPRKRESSEPVVLVVSGSPFPFAREQLMVLRNERGYPVVGIPPGDLLEAARTEELRELRQVVGRVVDLCSCSPVVVLSSALEQTDVVDLRAVGSILGMTPAEVAQTVAKGLGLLVKAVAAQVGVLGGLYTSGGDVTKAVLREVGAWGVELRAEVMPLAAFGIVRGGHLDGIPMVSKGGLVGDARALVRCVDYLLAIGRACS